MDHPPDAGLGTQRMRVAKGSVCGLVGITQRTPVQVRFTLGAHAMNPEFNPMTRGRLKTRHIVLLVHLDEQRSVLRAAKAANRRSREHRAAYRFGGIARRAAL
jgi:hypothetical protein